MDIVSASRLEDFDRVKSQIGCCGIWCGSCVLGNGALGELTTKYEKKLAAYGLKEWTPDGFDHAGFSRSLDEIRRSGTCQGCRKGGGRENCEIRVCMSERALSDCTDCTDRSKCGPRELLEKMRSGARAAGLFVKDDTDDRDEILAKWIAEIPRTWPSSILFMEDRQ